MKYAIFVIGERDSGKSTLIRSLTGISVARKGKLWRIKSRSAQPMKAFVLLSAPQEMSVKKYSPNDFPQKLEQEFRVNRNNYDILITAMELSSRVGYSQYILQTQNQGFGVRLAVINLRQDGTRENPVKIQSIQNFAQQNNVPMALIDASDDPNIAAGKIRNNLYPS